MKRNKLFVVLMAAMFGFIGCAPKVGENTGSQAPATVEQSTVSKYEEFVKNNKVYIPSVVKAGVSFAMAELSDKEKAEFAKWAFIISNGLYAFTTGEIVNLEDVMLIINKMGGEVPELAKYQGLAEALTGFLKIKMDEVKQNFNGDVNTTISVITIFADSLRAELKPYLVAE